MVGHMRTASVNVVPECMTPVVVECRALCRESPHVAVGHSDDEEPLSSVRGANVRGADEAREHSIAEPAEVTRNSVQPSRNKGRDVFSDDHLRPALVDDSREFGPEAGARPVEPGALARDRDVLTRESSDDGERLKSERV